MITPIHSQIRTLLFTLSFSFVIGLFSGSTARAQNVAIGYQGQLTEAGAPANGDYDMQFKLFDSGGDGAGLQQGQTIAEPAVPVVGGAFRVTPAFAAGDFNGSPRFLEVGVRLGGNGGAYTILTPRQEVTYIPYAVHSLSAAKLDGFSANRFVQINPDGNVGIGTQIPTAGYRLEVAGATQFRPGNGTVQFGSPNAELGMSITPTLGNRADLRFDGSVLKLAAGVGVVPPSPNDGIAISTAGNVGIGNGNPSSDYRLHVKGATQLSPGNGTMQFGSPNAELGMTMTPNAGNRADLRFDGAVLKLVAGTGAVPPSPANGIAITTAGNVGIGTETPTSKLQIVSQDALSIRGFQPFLTLRDSSQSDSSIKIQAAARSLHVWTSRPLLGFPLIPDLTVSGTGKVGIGTTTPRRKLDVQGDVTQTPESGGFVKAMASIDPFLPASQYVVRSFNSQTTLPITVERTLKGLYKVDFGFGVSDRFVSITPRRSSTGAAGGMGVISEAVDNHLVIQFGDFPFTNFDSAFDVIVY